MNDSMTKSPPKSTSKSTSMEQNALYDQYVGDYSAIPRHYMASAGSTSSSISQQTDDSGFSMSSGFTFSQNQCMEKSSFPHCGDVEKYKKLAKIGQGTYGEVFKACNPSNNQIVALKRILSDDGKMGFSMTTLREIRILQRVKHKNIVNLIEVCRSMPNATNGHRFIFYLVFEFCEHDLAGLLSNTTVRFNLGEIKSVVKQLLDGVYFLHHCKIMHRDLKPANILVTKSGVVKLADFGLARQFNLPNDPCRSTTPSNQMVTLWYRPPELLLGEKNCTSAIDMWSIGCIMAEMWTRTPIMQGKTEQEQISIILGLCGFSPIVWPNIVKLPLYGSICKMFNKETPRIVKTRLRPYVKDNSALNLIDKLLHWDPMTRFDANEALDHAFFYNDPLPCDLSKLFANHTRSMFDFHTRQRPNKNRTQDIGFMDRIY